MRGRTREGEERRRERRGRCARDGDKKWLAVKGDEGRKAGRGKAGEKDSMAEVKIVENGGESGAWVEREVWRLNATRRNSKKWSGAQYCRDLS